MEYALSENSKEIEGKDEHFLCYAVSLSLSVWLAFVASTLVDIIRHNI